MSKTKLIRLPCSHCGAKPGELCKPGCPVGEKMK